MSKYHPDKPFILKGQPRTTLSGGEENNHDWPYSTVHVGEESNVVIPAGQSTTINAETTNDISISYHQGRSGTMPTAGYSTTVFTEEGNPVYPILTTDVPGAEANEPGMETIKDGPFGKYNTPVKPVHDRPVINPNDTEEPKYRQFYK